jgi:PhnB protein
MNESQKITFAPQLFIQSGVTNIDFYVRAFGAIELTKWLNDDGTTHVAELSIDGAIFHLHEESLTSGSFSPERHGGTTADIGLFVPDVYAFIARAVAAGATEISPPQDYEYGYRQGKVKDPFGHCWLIEKKI